VNDTIQFYAGATLTLTYEFRDPSNSALPYAIGASAQASVVNSTLGFDPMVTITDYSASDVQVELQSGNTANMPKRQQLVFQVKVDLCDVGLAGDPANTVIILQPTEVMAL
jgi:hypothetical protein